MYPTILHQTWKTKDLSGVPEFEACANSWRALHPGYDYRLWDDKENEVFVASQFPDYLATWVSFDRTIKRLDTIRYMWMFAFGGIYADLDMECLCPLDRLIGENIDSDIILFCDLDGKGRCISANPALIISKPGSEFWLEVLEYARVNSRKYVTRSTGPEALARVARRRHSDHRLALLDQNRLFIRKYSKSFYAQFPGNENDAVIYKNVFCTTPKPAKYHLDKTRKYVADWHGTPAHLRWHNEYSRLERLKHMITGFADRIRGS